MAAPRRFGSVIAERKLTSAGVRPKPITITLGKPRLPKGERDWECPFRITGGGIRVLEYGYGVDSMQALAVAYQGIRYFLEKSGKSFEWHGIQFPVGGIQLLIPMNYPQLTKRLERLVYAEVKRDTARLRRRHEQRQTRKKSTARKSG